MKMMRMLTNNLAGLLLVNITRRKLMFRIGATIERLNSPRH